MASRLKRVSLSDREQCDREWFHLECVNLTEIPSRTTKWYCPECRVKLNKNPDGMERVGRR